VYAKLFTSIYQGTLRGNSHGLLVFTNLLAHADQHGVVDIHPRAIADEVGLTVEQVRAALVVLQSPDLESRSPEEEGRRIVLIDQHRDWGWRVVNYVKYRSIRNEDDRRVQNREAQQRWRERNQSKPHKPPSAHTEAEAEAEADKHHPTPRKRGSEPDGFAEFWKAYPRKTSKPSAERAFRALAPSAEVLSAMLAGIRRDCGTEQWQRDGGQFIPHPATWIRGRRWEDVIEAPAVDPAPLMALEASRTVLEDMDRARVAAQSPEAQEARRKVMASIRRVG